MLSDLPYDIKRYEILPKLDSISCLCLRIALLNQPFRELTPDEQKNAAGYGLNIVKKFWKYIDKKTIINHAILYDNVDIYYFAKQRRCKEFEFPIILASTYGSLNIFKLMYLRFKHLYSSCLAIAIKHDHLNIVKLILDQGYKVNMNLCEIAIKNKSASVLHYLLENRYDFSLLY